MTEFRLPPLVVDFNQLWLQADVRGDSGNWAWRAAANLLSRPHWASYRTPDGEKRLTALMRRAAVIAREHGASASMGFILIPSPGEGIKGMGLLPGGPRGPGRPRGVGRPAGRTRPRASR